jgi:hypothetical protein
MKLEAIDWCGGVYSHEWGNARPYDASLPDSGMD